MKTTDINALTADVAMPVDAKTGNLLSQEPTRSTSSLYLWTMSTTSTTLDGALTLAYNQDASVDVDNNNTDSDDTSSGELPGWTWGAIGGVVVVAFIAGAFILSRGGGDGEDKDWDY